jgi:D-alanine transaminase
MASPIVYLRNGANPHGAFLERAQAFVSPDDRGFVFGDGVYEVVRAYSGRLFMLAEHMGRLARSLREARIPADGLPDIVAAMTEVLRRSPYAAGEAMVYVQVTRGEARRAHAWPEPPPHPTVFMSVSPAPDMREAQRDGVALATVADFRWARCDIKTIGLQANVLALQSAREAGADEVLFVRDGIVTEGSHTNFFGAVGGRARTHPTSNHILHGITRSVVLDICRQESVPVSEEALSESDLDRLDEAFITATSYEIAPVVRLDGRAIGGGVPGPTTRRLQEAWARRIEAFRASPCG